MLFVLVYPCVQCPRPLSIQFSCLHQQHYLFNGVTGDTTKICINNAPHDEALIICCIIDSILERAYFLHGAHIFFNNDQDWNSCGTLEKNIARIANAVQCHSWLSRNKKCHEFTFSIVRIVISAETIKSQKSKVKSSKKVPRKFPKKS